MYKIKTNQLSIIKIKNKTYLPYQLHQLPKWFNKYTTNYFNLKGYTYISLDNTTKIIIISTMKILKQH